MSTTIQMIEIQDGKKFITIDKKVYNITNADIIPADMDKGLFKYDKFGTDAVFLHMKDDNYITLKGK
jgi:hypothetical protein